MMVPSMMSPTVRLSLVTAVACISVLTLDPNAGAAAAPAAATHAPPAKVLIIGMDGASWNVLDPFIAQGVTPNLARLKQAGAYGPLRSFWPLRTPQVWTSIATGKLPGQHGIWDHLSSTIYNPPPFRTKKRKRLTTADRKSKALWQLLGAHGLRTFVVGWIESWPAEKVPGATIVAPAEVLDRRQSTIKGSFYHHVPGTVQPARLAARVEADITAPAQLPAAALRPFADVPAKGSPLLRLPFMKRYLYNMRWSIARARSVEKIGLDLYDAAKPDVAMFYFQCTDSLSHRYWIFHKSLAAIRRRFVHHHIPTAHLAELKRRFGSVVRACWHDVDTRIGHLLARMADANTLVLIMSDHGFGDAPIPHPDPQEPYGGNHRDNGLIIARGPGVAAGEVSGISVLDITPTVLTDLGLPYADDMRGRPALQLFTPAWQKTHPAHSVATFEAAPQLKCPYPGGWPSRKDRPLATSR